MEVHFLYMTNLTKACLTLLLVPFPFRCFIRPKQTTIICSKLFSRTWNPCIRLECEFLNFWSVIHSGVLHMFFLLTKMRNWPYNVHPNVMTLFVTRWNQNLEFFLNEIYYLMVFCIMMYVLLNMICFVYIFLTQFEWLSISHIYCKS
jgi:hypothetical protein